MEESPRKGRAMQDIGPKPQVFDIETETKTNTNYRTTA